VILADALRDGASVVAAELRPPRAELETIDGMEAWIDTHHAVRTLTRQGTFVFLTDNAIGTSEEDNLRHLITNLGTDVPLERVVPFLTAKHSMSYCLSYAERARQHGIRSLVVLGGDRTVGPPRSVEHAWQLRSIIKRSGVDLSMGGWANPYADPAKQVEYLIEANFTGDFYLTQIVSHHNLPPVARFVDESLRRGLTKPGLFGIFYYRSANPRTLNQLSTFLPVPAKGLSEEFGAGLSADDVCARTLRGLLDVGARHFYISNLPLQTAQSTLNNILQRVGLINVQG
jgi:5,10-methylenetetrahydrofolate reductase